MNDLSVKPDQEQISQYVKTLIMPRVGKKPLPVLTRLEVQAFINRCYVETFQRPVDPGGLQTYTRLILNQKLQPEDLPAVLRSSPEYKHNILKLEKLETQGLECPAYLVPKKQIPQPFKPKKIESITVVYRKKEIQSHPDLVSIIILEYSTLELLVPCVQSIVWNTAGPYELIVVDNASTDESLQWALSCPDIHVVIENKTNLGWTKANNYAMKIAKGNYLLLLNSDIEVRSKGWTSNMIRCFDDSLVGTVGSKLLYPNGKLQHIGGGIYKKNPYHPYDKERPSLVPYANMNRQVPYNTGACLMIRRSILNKVGWFDENFFFGYDDVDYGLRVTMAGFKNICCCRDMEVIHHWAYTQRKIGKGITQSSLQLHHSKWDDKLDVLSQKVKLSW